MDLRGAVHPCLLIPEIISLICAEISDDYLAISRLRLQTLSALARTCRLFQELALDYLWSELSTIAPLVKCMPLDLWREERSPDQRSSELLISRPIKPSDWSRFLVHAPRVRKLGSAHVDCSGRYIQRIGANVYQVLSVATPTTTLLPNLQALSWFPPDQHTTFPYISLFLGPRLLSIELSIRSWEVPGLSLVGTLSSRLPSLRRFRLYLEDDTTAVADVVSATVCGWNQLRDLEVNQLTYTALMHVGRLPHLWRLSCVLTGDTMPAALPGLSESHWFPKLSHIFIQSQNLSSCSFFIQALSASPVSCFGLRHFGSSGSPGWRRVLNSMRDHCNRSTLSSVSLWDDDDDDDALQHDADVLTIENIRPLFGFSKLHTVNINLQDGVDIDDAAMEELAKSWPQLECFSLSTPNTAQRKPCVTLAGLIPLAKYCPILRTVAINIDTRDALVSQVRPAGGTVNPYFDCLCIGDSVISDPMPVAAFLSDIFPKVKSIYRFGGRSLDEDSKWRQVESLIPTFVSIRSQERKYESECVGGITYGEPDD